MRRSRLSLLAALLAAPLFSAPAPAPALASLTYSGDQSALEAIDRDLTAAGQDPAKLAAVEDILFATLRHSDSTFAARQAAAQRLGLVLAAGPAKASADAYRPLGAWLADDRDSDLARLALDPAPGDVIDDLFLAALGKANGRTRLGVIDSIARRRIARAVAPLTPLLTVPETATAAAAARALGAIGDDAALAALQKVAEPSPAYIAAAKLAAAARVAPATGLPVLYQLQREAQSPVHRAAAFRLSLDLDPATAAARLAVVLAATDWDMKQPALEAIVASRAPNLTSTLTGALESWDVPTQVAVLAALARRGDPAAIPAVTTATAHRDPAVRAAAIEALGLLPGTSETASLLAMIAGGTEAADAKVARQSLARLNGPDVSATILAGTERGAPSVRAAFLEQIALRGMTEGLPLLLKCRGEKDAVVRAAAVGAFGELAPFSEQKAILDWTIEAADSTEQTRALRALVNITLRNPNVAERGRAFYALIEFVQPEMALRLLPALTRLGGEPSAECAARLAVRDDPKVAQAATAALTRWPDATALPSLVTVAEKAALPESRAAALDGAMRTLERARTAWTLTATEQLKRLFGSTEDVEKQRAILALLHRANDPAAYSFVDDLKANEKLGAAATSALEAIRANLKGPPKARASKPEGLAQILDRNTGTRWTTPALGEEWVELDFHLARPFTRVTLDQTGRDADFPERYEVFVTDDPQKPGKPVVSGPGQRGRTMIPLPAGTRGRYLVIRNVAGRSDGSWSIAEVYID